MLLNLAKAVLRFLAAPIQSKIPLPVLMCSVLWQGCATMTGSHQIISIDSIPRGLHTDVLEEKEEEWKFLGKTPFYYNLPRTRELNLRVRKPDSQLVKEFSTDCSFRWGVAGLGNGILAAINPLAGGLCAVYDLISGNAWNCNRKIKINSELSDPHTHEKECFHIFVIPPYQEHQADSFALMSRWMRKTRKKQPGCYSFVPPYEVIRLHSLLNIGFHESFDFSKLQEHKKVKIGYTTGAGVMVNLEESDSEREHVAKFSAKAWDLHSGRYIAGLFEDTEVSAIDTGSGPKSVLRNLNTEIFPNSIGYEARGTTHSDDSDVSSRSKIKSLPSIISSWSLLNITSPEAFEPWDISFGLFPGFQFYFFEWKYPATNNMNEFRWKLFHLMGTYEARMTLFTALGQFSLGTGLGPMLSYSSPSEGKKLFLGKFLMVLYLRYTAHLTQNLFTYSEFSSFVFRGHYSANRQQSRSFSDATIGLGYYVPDLYSGFSSWLYD